MVLKSQAVARYIYSFKKVNNHLRKISMAGSSQHIPISQIKKCIKLNKWN